ncbi:MAG: hypothetical protein AVO33_00515 [delta proteobacterium ML8_F1]|nr:MAG: hypothetical protein AVO33_00515 [delta proteobacterium ML8_F1]
MVEKSIRQKPVLQRARSKDAPVDYWFDESVWADKTLLVLFCQRKKYTIHIFEYQYPIHFLLHFQVPYQRKKPLLPAKNPEKHLIAPV